MNRTETLPKIEDCIKGRVYKIRCRNLVLGVWNGKDGFIGIRTKWHDRYLFTEYHYDTGAPYGTVASAKDIGIDLPEDILVKEDMGVSYDGVTKREVDFDTPIADGGRGWYFVDTGESSTKISPYLQSNKKLFEFLEEVEENYVQANTQATE